MSSSPVDRHFLLRKIHSLLGIIPIGAFLSFHLFENSLAKNGADYFFSHVIEKIDSMPYIQYMEVFAIALPILFHAIYGVIIWIQGKSNLSVYGTYRNWMYWVQRVSGGLAFIFILCHVWATRMQVLLGNLEKTELFGAIAATVQTPWGLGLYILGIVAAVVHFSNGLWLFCITWGITIGRRSQKISTYVFALLGLLLLVFAALSLQGFLAYDPSAVVEVEAATH